MDKFVIIVKFFTSEKVYHTFKIILSFLLFTVTNCGINRIGRYAVNQLYALVPYPRIF